MSVSSGTSGTSSVSVPSVKSMSSQSSMSSVSGRSISSEQSLSSQGSSASSAGSLSSKDSPAPSKELTEAIGKCENAKVETQIAIDNSVKQTSKQEQAINRFKDSCASKPCKCKKQNKEFQESLANNKAKNDEIQDRLDNIGECGAPIVKSSPAANTSPVKINIKKKGATMGEMEAQIGAELSQDN